MFFPYFSPAEPPEGICFCQKPFEGVSRQSSNVQVDNTTRSPRFLPSFLAASRQLIFSFILWFSATLRIS